MSELNPIYFRDPIYGLIELSKESQWVISTPAFQRLKNLRQLGALDFVFPYASHRRFEHSLGVAYLARMAGKFLQKVDPKKITNRQILWLEIAGLCHDIGHGPYSHVFDNFLETLPESKDNHFVHHEHRSQLLVENILSQRPDLFTAEDICVIKYLINPDDNEPPCPRYLTHIVNNPIHKLDVDKIDYLNRDAQYLRYDLTYNQFDPLQLLSRTRIVDDTWMFHIQDQGLIYDLICRRLLLHTNRYSHPKVHAASHMIVEVLRLSDHHFHFLETAKDPDKFISLDDSIIEDIFNKPSSTLEDAKTIIRRLLKREFYEHIGDYHQSSNLDENLFTEIPWKIYSDKSSPLTLLPKVQYHFNGQEVKGNYGNTVYRLFRRDK